MIDWSNKIHRIRKSQGNFICNLCDVYILRKYEGRMKDNCTHGDTRVLSRENYEVRKQ